MQQQGEEIIVVDELGKHVVLLRGRSADGAPDLRTRDGEPVRALPDGSFEAVTSGAKFRPEQ